MTSAGSDTELLRLADEVRAHAPAIAARVTDATLADPFWTKRYGERGRHRTEEDAAFHVEYLVQALVARDAELVRRYARWLQSLLTTRGMCTLHIDENLARVGAAVVNAVPRAFAIDGYVKAARAALLYPGGAAREIQSAAERVPFALRLHLAYLADAIALGRPDVFAAHARFAELGEELEHLERAILGDSCLSSEAKARAKEHLDACKAT